MEDKLFVIIDNDYMFYCYIILNTKLKEKTINKIIKKIYHNLLKCEDDFSQEFEKQIKNIKNIKVKSFIYNDLKYICI